MLFFMSLLAFLLTDDIGNVLTQDVVLVLSSRTYLMTI